MPVDLSAMLSHIEEYLIEKEERIKMLEKKVDALDNILVSLDNLVDKLETQVAELMVKPAPTPVPAPSPSPPPPVVIPTPPPSNPNYSLVIRPKVDTTAILVDRNDVLVDLIGLSLPNLNITLAVGVKNIRIQNGGCRSIFSQIPGNRQPCYDGLFIENVNLSNNVDSTMELHGNNTTLKNVRTNAQRYSLWLGQSEDVRNLTIDNCQFSSVGPESTVRVTDCFGVIVKDSQLSNGAKHCLRVHGKSSLISVRNTRCFGAGNGIAMGAMGPQVPGDVRDVIFEGVRVETTGPDVLNLARDGSLDLVKILDMSIREPAGWALVQEYINNHPGDWNVSGLKKI